MSKILIIEDNDSARENINEILELEGFETIAAAHGLQGLELAQQQQPDLIICDVMMPNLDGYEVLKNLSRNQSLASVPFIFLTAKSTQVDFRQGMNLGASDYLTKPFSPAELVQAVRTQLHKQDVFARVYAEKNKLAQLDPATQLPNRLSLNSRLALLADRTQIQDETLTLMVVAVDQFSLLSSALTLAENDDVFKLVAERLQSIAINFNHSSISASVELFRLEHNRFALLFKSTDNSIAALTKVARYITDVLKKPYKLISQTINITASVGIASTQVIDGHEFDASSPDNLAQDAINTLNYQLQNGSQSLGFYRRELTLNAAEKLNIANALHYAIRHGELQAYYQPQVDLETGQVIGVEALMRWHSAQLGDLSPTKFIPVAEEIGVIDEITNWMIWTACKQAKDWQKVMAKPISVSVNLSSLQLGHRKLVDTVAFILNQTGLQPQLLHLEITETAIIEHKEIAIDILRNIKKMGVKIAIDDFGSGYSGLGYLSTLPCNTIKIDRLFIQDIHHHLINQRIVSSLIDMALKLNLGVIAEGAETEEELAYLRSQKCPTVQGFIFAKPMQTEGIVAFVKNCALQAFV
ncbi:EAL domain-containing protein [Nodosilinea sp. E11]|uniref:EAL domain-containing response regulator n=1 Tax=Nodosilinea sp. E11 TaxID=3037479 RepID=UPI0029346ADB|nr:EAL domain-containing protein [Nodosilinea sp. E11]WOD41508.1 EAL domain-containing protein [Nodosilinea sp. E11]